MNIHIIVTGLNSWNPRVIFDSPDGISGTDIQAIGIAFELGRMGHAVTLWGPFSEDYDAEGVKLRRYTRYVRRKCELAIAFHEIEPLRQFTAPIRIVVRQTYTLTHNWDFSFATHLVTATPRNAQYLAEHYGGLWHVVPNAWDCPKERPVWAPESPPRLVWNTDPYRGLHVLLRLLPRIRREVPGLVLDVLGWVPARFDPDPERVGPELLPRAQEMRRWLEDQPDGAVVLHPRVSRNEALARISRASCLAYYADPPMPCEVFPLSVTDCLASGVPVVMRPCDGIEDVFREGAKIVWDEDRFVEETIEVLRNPGRAEELSLAGVNWARAYSFERAAQMMLTVAGT